MLSTNQYYGTKDSYLNNIGLGIPPEQEVKGPKVRHTEHKEQVIEDNFKRIGSTSTLREYPWNATKGKDAID